ncbi:ABC transporter substrate-binding protein [Alkalihalophilus marmarensis]|uniref:Peptide ABC transporter substrate-binding protein n=1 Tax=Alkalihalophilus marmarensis DSM 21297 TaxID=1188261 RepID=U6SJU7_9BACI|nr:ABC transporter substrate-binding protein [Alkalihalophilus marmarensis]ERN51994.1 peptide ABC transporter substrate-binding protein [Alkalihalophilus marmarensis DSM 21297]MED1603000.1 ABC transporter substrate-binding protein [Alkalihalophilus marmarensis]
MKHRLSFLMVLLLAFVLFLAACSSDDTSAPESGDGEAEEEVEGTDGESSGDQTLVFARGGDSVSLDYASVTDGESSRVTKNIYETLIEFDRDSFEIGPGLAHDWEVDDSGLRFVFHLEEGVTFHDGTDFNAEAVKLNFERWADPEHEYAFLDEGYTYSVYGTQFGGYKGDEGHVIEEINVLGDYEIEFVLNQPLGSFLQNMGMSYFAITSPQAFEEHGSAINENPVGTGPFKFVSWSRDDSIILEKNEDYWKEGLPKLDRVIFQVIPDNSARLTALRSGQIDIMDGLNPDDVAQIEGDDSLQVFERATNNIGYLGFHVEKEPFNDPVVRRAFNHAIDKEGLIAILYGGLAETAKNTIPPGYLGYNDGIDEYSYDPELAKELLAEAGIEDGFTFDLWTMPVARPYMPDPQRAAEAIQANLADVGITANIVTKEWATYLEETEQGKHDVFMLGWSGVNGDPDYFFSNLLHGDAIPGGNRSFYSNEEVNDLLVQAKTEVDFDVRAELYEQVQELIHEDAPMVPLVHSIPTLAGSSNVKNYVPHPSTSETLDEVELEN